MVRYWFSLLLCAALAGCTPFTTTVVLQDGSQLQANPSCTTGSGAGETLWGRGIEQGVPVSDIAKLRSHTGMESFIFGTAVVAGAVALAVHGYKSGQEGWIALGGATGGIALTQAILGAVFLVGSAGSLGRQCSPRSPWYPASVGP